jgi:radical SAM-linked protein
VSAEPAASRWTRLLFSFEKSGPAAWISHLDLMVVVERALARAGCRARFTEGYNPKPRLEFASPLSLGIDSGEEIASIDLLDADGPDDFRDRMNRALPAGMAVLRAAAVPQVPGGKRRSLMSLYWGADYEVIGLEGESRAIRLPAGGPSIRRTLDAEGVWTNAQVRRTATWATGLGGGPVSYFDALGSPVSGAS